MDPNTCLQRLLDAICGYYACAGDAARDHRDAAREAADDLCGWLGRGGYQPNWLDVTLGLLREIE